MTKLPRWNDLDALTAFVTKQVDDDVVNGLLYDVFLTEWAPQRELSLRERFEMMERRAIEAAERGDFRRLANLLEGNDFFTRQFLSKGYRIGPRAEALIAAYLRQAPRRRTRKLTITQLRAGSPSYEAADRVLAIQAVLKRHFPDEKGHRDKAIEIVAGGENEYPRSVRNFMEKGKHLYHHIAGLGVGDADDDIGSDPF